MVNQNRIYILDLYRFIAAVSVLLFHYAFLGSHFGKADISLPFLFPIAKYGYLGVELFFIISGFVILMSAQNTDLIGFLSSRIGRLYPAFWFCCTVTALILFLFPIEFTITLKLYLINMTMLNGFVGVENIDGSYWTLLYEIIFYALIAVILLFRLIKYCESIAYIWLVLTFSVLYFDTVADTLPSPIFNILFLGSYSPFFVSGMLLFLIWRSGLTIYRSLGLLVSCGVSVYSAIIRAIEFNYDLNVYTVGASVIMIYIIMFLSSLNLLSIKNSKFITMLGALTYPLYLLHHSIGYVIFNQFSSRINHYVLFIGVIILMLILSWFVSRYIEKKWCKMLRKFTDANLRNILPSDQSYEPKSITK